jgi:anti-anti-sigma factor
MSEDTLDTWEPGFESLGRKLEAITEYLTVLGYLDGEIAPRERELIQSHLERLARRRASEAGEARDREERGQRWTERLLAYFTAFERKVAQVHASLAVEGADGRRFALAELKLACAHTFQRLDREGRAELLALADELIAADSVVHPREAAFRAELSALLDAPLLPDEAAEPPAEEPPAEEPPAEKDRALLVERREGRVVVSCDRPLGPAIARRLEALLEETGASGAAVTLDLGGVESISNAGLRTLVRCAGQAAQRGAPLRVLNLQPQVERVLELMGLTPSFTNPQFRLAEPGAPRKAPPRSAASQVYREEASPLERVRQLFPTPVSDRAKDAHMLVTLLRGVDRIDAMKSDKPFLGERLPLDYERARAFRMPEALGELEPVIDGLTRYLQGHVLPGHPLTQQNVIPPSTIASIAGLLFAGLHNPNVVWDHYSHKLAEAEVEAVAAVAALVGYDPAQAGGVFTFGGSGTLLYALKLGIEKAYPGTMRQGLQGPARVLVSDVAHYGNLTAAGWLGLGLESVIKVPTDADNSIQLDKLEAAARDVLKSGARLAAIVATGGSTDSFGLDNIRYVVALRDKLVEEHRLDYRPHVHVDAVIGWAFAVFNHYDFTQNPLGFGPATLRSLWDTRETLQHLHLADSIGIDFHKTGFTPYTSSLFLVRDAGDFQRLARESRDMPYMFQHGQYHPGEFTLETSRNGGGVLAALANLQVLGLEGYQALLGHLVSMAEHLRGRLQRLSSVVVLNDYNCGPVTLFRVYPPGTNASRAYREEITQSGAKAQLEANNAYNKEISRILLERMLSGDGVVLSETDQYRLTSYGAPIVALKSYVMSPFVNEQAMELVVREIEEAQEALSR